MQLLQENLSNNVSMILKTLNVIVSNHFIFIQIPNDRL